MGHYDRGGTNKTGAARLCARLDLQWSWKAPRAALCLSTKWSRGVASPYPTPTPTPSSSPSSPEPRRAAADIPARPQPGTSPAHCCNSFPPLLSLPLSRGLEYQNNALDHLSSSHKSIRAVCGGEASDAASVFLGRCEMVFRSTSFHEMCSGKRTILGSSQPV